MAIDISPYEVLDLYKMGVGSRAFVLNQVRRALAELGIDNPRLSRLVDQALEANASAARLNYVWEQRKHIAKLSRGGAFELDNKIDSTLGNIYNLTKTFASSYGDSEQKRAAVELEEQLFPNGVRPVTTQTFENQWALNREVLERLGGAFADHVETLGLSPLVEDLERLNGEFEEALVGKKARTLEFSEVRAARKADERACTKVIFVIYGDYIDDDQTREVLLSALADQQQRIRRAMKRHGTVPTVDPDSGEFVDNDVVPVE